MASRPPSFNDSFNASGANLIAQLTAAAQQGNVEAQQALQRMQQAATPPSNVAPIAVRPGAVEGASLLGTLGSALGAAKNVFVNSFSPQTSPVADVLAHPQDFSPQQMKFEPNYVFAPRAAIANGVKALSPANMGSTLGSAINWAGDALSPIISSPYSRSVDQPAAIKMPPRQETIAPVAPAAPQRSAVDDQMAMLWPALLQQEGGVDPKTGQWRTSPKGAYGPAQLMPATAAEMGAKLKLDHKDPVNNEIIGKAYLREQLQRFGSPALALAAYNAGPGAVEAYMKGRPLPAETVNYVQKIMGGNVGGMGFQNGYDGQYVNAALNQVDNATAEALKPQSVSWDRPAAPEMPASILPAKMDWTKADAALQALRPAEMMETERRKVMRANVWGGLAQGLASLPEGAGLGRVLAAVGAGALAGKAAGMHEVQARMDDFDEKMSRWKMAVYTKDVQQAQTAAQEAQTQATILNQDGLRRWQTKYSQWAQDNQVNVGPNGITVNSSKDGKMTTKFIPMAGAIKAAGALEKARILGNAGQQFNQGNFAVAQAENGLLAAHAVSVMNRSSGDDTATAAIAAPAFQSGMIVTHGLLPSVLDEKSLQEFSRDAQVRAQQAGLTPGTKEYSEGLQNIQTGMLTEYALAHPDDKKFMDQFIRAGSTGTQIFAADRFRDSKTRTVSSPKGTTVTETQ